MAAVNVGLDVPIVTMLPGPKTYRLRCAQLRSSWASARQAVRNVARSLATTLWGMWKSSGDYHPAWVGVPAAAVRAAAVSE